MSERLIFYNLDNIWTTSRTILQCCEAKTIENSHDNFTDSGEQQEVSLIKIPLIHAHTNTKDQE